MIKDGIRLYDYDSVFDNNPDHNFFYNAPGYNGPKLVVGRVSLKNAVERLKKDEVYAVVKYHEGEELPEQYMPIDNPNVNGGDTLFATIRPELRLYDICYNGGIQRISRLPDDAYDSPTWLLGPGPDKVSLDELISSQLKDFEKTGPVR